MTQATDPSLAGVDAAVSLVEGGVRMMVHALPRLVVLRRGDHVGTLNLCEVTRALRGAAAARTVAEVVADRDAAADDPPPTADPPNNPPAAREALRLLQPDPLLPSQYLDRVRRSAQFEPERRLMVAVLQQGVDDYLRHLAPRDDLEMQLWRDAAAWIEDNDSRWLYSFRRICDTLDIDADYLRGGLHAARARLRGAAAPREAAPEAESARPAGRRASGGAA
jgi:hypothetical protein